MFVTNTLCKYLKFPVYNAIYNTFLFDTGHSCHDKTYLHHLKIGSIKL